MDIKQFYGRLLGLPPSWEVSEVTVDPGSEAATVKVTLAQVPTGEAGVACPRCGRSCPPAEETALHSWRHVDTCGWATRLEARLVAVQCPDHGEQVVAPPWGDAASPVTDAFEAWFTQVAKEMVEVRKAARFAGVDPPLARQVLRRSRERQAEAKSAAAIAGKAKSASPSALPIPGKQLSLFDQNDMTFVNQGIQALRKLDLEKALECFRRHRQLYPKGYDVGSRIALAEKLLDGIREIPVGAADRAAQLLGLWNAIESGAKGSDRQEATLLADVKPSFFAFVLDEIEEAGKMEAGLLPGDVPVGLLLMHADRLDDAVESLQACIRDDPHHAGLYGYLGDAYHLRGESRIARQCYREGCLIDPAGFDWEHVVDDRLRELKDDLYLEYGLDRDLAAAWLPSHARIEGLFDRKVVRINDGLKELVQEFLKLEKALNKKPDAKHSAALFFRGLILCENADSLWFVKTIDLIQVRRRMMDANPRLFAAFMERLSGGSG